MKIITASYKIDHFDPVEDARRIATAIRMCYKYDVPDTYEEQCALIRRVRDKDKKRPHLSVLEHSSLSVIFYVNRGIANELVRHRLASFSQESTRYCNYGANRFGHELTFVQDSSVLEDSSIFNEWFDGLECSEKQYFHRLALGQKPEQARGCLPVDLKTELYTTANYREWRHIFNLRGHQTAHYQMVEVIRPLFEEVKSKAPWAFDDIEM